MRDILKILGDKRKLLGGEEKEGGRQMNGAKCVCVCVRVLVCWKIREREKER